MSAEKMFRQLTLHANVLVETPDELTIEESHFRPWLLYGIILSMWGGLAGFMYYQTGELFLLGISLTLGFFVFVCPFLIVMLFSGYHRFTVHPEKSLSVTWVSDIGWTRRTDIPWAELESVVCHLYPEKQVYVRDPDNSRRGRYRTIPPSIWLKAMRKNKQPLTMLARPYEPLQVDKMRRYLGEKFELREETRAANWEGGLFGYLDRLFSGKRPNHD